MARILIGNIKGPKGDTGPQGKQGPTGPQGPKGDTGPMPALINNAATTSAGVGALDAAMGKTLGDRIDVLNNKINFEYPYDGVKTFSTVYTEMATSSTVMIAVGGGSTIANEIGYPSDPSFGALIFIWKKSGWRGGAISIPLSGWANSPICIAEIHGSENTFSWKELALKDDLTEHFQEDNSYQYIFSRRTYPRIDIIMSSSNTVYLRGSTDANNYKQIRIMEDGVYADWIAEGETSATKQIVSKT